MFSIKTLASTVAAAGLVSVIGLAYAQTEPRIESPSTQDNTSMPNNSTTNTSGNTSTQGTTQGNTSTLENSTSTQGNTTSRDYNTGTQGNTMSDNTLRADGSRADGSIDREPRADRN